MTMLNSVFCRHLKPFGRFEKALIPTSIGRTHKHTFNMGKTIKILLLKLQWNRTPKFYNVPLPVLHKTCYIDGAGLRRSVAMTTVAESSLPIGSYSHVTFCNNHGSRLSACFDVGVFVSHWAGSRYLGLREPKERDKDTSRLGLLIRAQSVQYFQMHFVCISILYRSLHKIISFQYDDVFVVFMHFYYNYLSSCFIIHFITQEQVIIIIFN